MLMLLQSQTLSHCPLVQPVQCRFPRSHRCPSPDSEIETDELDELDLVDGLSVKSISQRVRQLFFDHNSISLSVG